ncbi:MAG: glycoside hydrolase family 16 protein [Phycisphaeraceae bacterium]
MAKRYASPLSLLLMLITTAAFAAEPKALMDLSDGGESLKTHADHADVQVVKTEQGSALEMRIGHKGGDYPGVHVRAPQEAWDLSGYAAVEFDLVNTSDKAARIHGRVDNPGDWKTSPWSIHAITLKPGERKTLRVVLGKSYGNAGYELDLAKVSQVVVFAEKPKEEVKIHILAIRAVAPGSEAAAQPAKDKADKDINAVAPQAEGDASRGGGGGAKLLDPSKDEVQLKPSSTQVTAKREPTGKGMGLAVRIEAGDDGYPGLAISPKSGDAWDLSKYGHVEARIINTGDKALGVSLRVDNAGDWKKNPWNTEAKTIKPGETGTVKVIFGHQYGFKKGYALDPSKVVGLLVFTGKAGAERTFLIDSIVAGGEAGEKPAVNPKDVRIKPKDGLILGKGVTVDPGKQITTVGAAALAAGDAVRLTFAGAPGGGNQSATIKPATGRWDLRDAIQVRVTLRNDGQAPITPRVRIESNGGPSEWATADTAIAPGQARDVTASFISSIVWQGPDDFKGEHIPGKANTINKVTSDAVSGITIAATISKDADEQAALRVEAITAEAPPVQLPAWLGNRPPIEGEWKLTFEDNFDGPEIDQTRWNIYASNFWDSRTHFSRDNLILENGMAKLRYEKKLGFANDDPNQKLPKTGKNESDYACGHLDTYGKWVQRYGYFEARVKLPTAPGLWPAFWLMPDRGEAIGPQWKRADTKNGGMEFDILEHLTRWGPHRYNIAMHWDGYQKEHKATGATIYAGHDKDGFITSGLLWLPGQAVIYANGREIARWDNQRVSSAPSYPILYMVSGGWDNNALDDTQLPDHFVIDYIRIWQRGDLASEVDSAWPKAQPAADAAAPAAAP